MQLADYRELYDLLIAGAVYRVTQGDEQALDQPGRLMLALRAALPSEDRALVFEAIEADRVDRLAPRTVSC